MLAAWLNSVALHYQWNCDDGERPVLVFANSLGTDLRIWDKVALEVGCEASVLTYDMRGHGLSDLGNAKVTIALHVEDLIALLDHLKLTAVTICGLSVGGQVALGLAGRRPDLVQRLVLLNTAPKIGTQQSWNDRIEAVSSKGIGSIADAVLARWFTPAFRRDDNPDFALTRNMLLRQSAAAYTATCAAIRDTDLTSVAARLRVPTLCISSAEDEATPPALIEEMARVIRGSRYHTLERCGHIPCLEQPTLLANLILSFIAENHGEAASE